MTDKPPHYLEMTKDSNGPLDLLLPLSLSIFIIIFIYLYYPKNQSQVIMNTTSEKVTLVIQIGNTDNKLTQQEWSSYQLEVKETIKQWSTCIHFDGNSDPEAAWQNKCWVIETDRPATLKLHLTAIRKKYRQDSIALSLAETSFI